MRSDDVPAAALLDRAASRVNPVLVKEVRAALRGRAFAIGFSIVLVLALIASTFAMIVGGTIEDAGAGFGLAYLASVGGIFALGAHGLVPFAAMASMSAEHDENSLELLQLSGISPGRLVLGKLGAAAVQAVLIYAAFLPFLAFAFLLQGVDLLVLTAAVVASFTASIAFSSFGILLGGVCRWRWMRVLGYVLLAIVLMIGVQGMFGWLAMGYFAGGSTSWRDFLLGLAIAGCFTALALVYTSTRLQHAEENRSTAFRVLGTVALAVACAFGVASGSADEFFGWALGGIAFALPSLILGLSEPTRLPRAVLARARRGRARAWLAPWLPGGGRAVLLLFVDCAIVLAACVAGLVIHGGGGGVGFGGIGGAGADWLRKLHALAAFEVWLCAVLLVASGVFARWLDRAWVAMLARIACILLPVAVILLPTFLLFAVAGSSDPFAHAGNPVHVVRQHFDGSAGLGIGGIAVLLAAFAAGVALNAPRVARSFGEVRRAREAAR